MRLNTLVVCILLLIFLVESQVFASDKLDEILAKPAEYDGRTVTLEGEVVGIAVRSGGAYFIQLNQDSYSKKSIAEGGKLYGQNLAVPVYLSKDLYEKISFFGDYHNKGDIVKVQGIFNASCEKHGGESDIHANQLNIIKKGYRLKHNLNHFNAAISIALFLVAILFAFFVRLRQ